MTGASSSVQNCEIVEDLLGGPFFMQKLRRRDSGGRKETKAYSSEEAGGQSWKKKNEYEGAGSAKRNADLS